MKKSIFYLVSQKTSFLLDIIFPPKCIFCNCILQSGAKLDICDKCYINIPFIKGEVCIKCGQQLSERHFERKCFDCRNMNHYFEYCVSPCQYSGIIRKVIIRFKFLGKKRYAKTLGQLMTNSLIEKENLSIFNMIAYTPLHKTRKQKRGFNQAQLLANIIGQNINCPVINNILIKTKNTSPQEKLTKLQRQKNIKGAFKANKLEIIKGKTILLIDDVYTTGATVNECAKVLKEAGADAIYVATAAIGKGYS